MDKGDLKPYDMVYVKDLLCLSGKLDRYTAIGRFIKEEIRGSKKGMALVRIGNVELHVPFSKLERMEN